MTQPININPGQTYKAPLKADQKVVGSKANDNVDISNAQGGMIFTKGGDDKVTISNKGSILGVSAGAGNDTVDIKSDNASKVSVWGNSGDDHLSFAGSDNGLVRIGMIYGNNDTKATGDGNTYRVYEGEDGKKTNNTYDQKGDHNNTTFLGGTGNTGATFKGAITGNANNISGNTGDSNDTIDVNGNTNRFGNLTLGGGDDTLNVKGDGNTGTIDGGAGKDTVSIDGKDNKLTVKTDSGDTVKLPGKAEDWTSSKGADGSTVYKDKNGNEVTVTGDGQVIDSSGKKIGGGDGTGGCDDGDETGGRDGDGTTDTTSGSGGSDTTSGSGGTDSTGGSGGQDTTKLTADQQKAFNEVTTGPGSGNGAKELQNTLNTQFQTADGKKVTDILGAPKGDPVDNGDGTVTLNYEHGSLTYKYDDSVYNSGGRGHWTLVPDKGSAGAAPAGGGTDTTGGSQGSDTTGGSQGSDTTGGSQGSDTTGGSGGTDQTQLAKDKAAIDYLIGKAGDNNITADGSYNSDDVGRAASYTSDQATKDDLNKIAQNLDPLSGLDGEGGDLNKGELQNIRKLMDQGYSLDQIIQAGKDEKDDDYNSKSTLIDHKVAPGFANADDQKKAQTGLQFLIDHDGDNNITADGSYNSDDLNRAAAYTSDQATKDLIGKIAQNKDALSMLDGEGGDLNKDELTNILNLVNKGFSIDYLIEEGKLLDSGNYGQGTDLNNIGFPANK